MADHDGTLGNDSITGDASAETFDLLAGDDTARGYGGDDTIWGGAGNDALYGNAGADHLYGGADDDSLYGGTGADSMIGGDGDDTYYVDHVGDYVREETADSGMGGTDSVFSSVTYDLSGYMRYAENLTLTGDDAIDGRGNNLNNVIQGNGADNALFGYGGHDSLLGGGGDDTLDGGGGNDTLDGGTGNDAMAGGTGSDRYYVDSATDSLAESGLPAGGNDRVYSTVTWTLGGYVEKLYLVGADAIDGSGNGLNNYVGGNDARNVLAGGAGNDTLQGNGGADSLDGGEGNDVLRGGGGVDSMAGGDGSDIYYVSGTDVAWDLVSETEADPVVGGVERVYSSINYALGPNLENLYLTGTAAWSWGNGNALDNELHGNGQANSLDGKNGNDTLWGHGGHDGLWANSGAATMYGGDGDDVYYVDDAAADAVIEENSEAGGGMDRIHSRVDWGLGGTREANVENLTLASGTTDIDGGGNELANVLTGNWGNNYLWGFAGADSLAGSKGNDSLWGGADRDTLSGADGSDSLMGEDANDSLWGDAGEDTLLGGAGSDTLAAGLGNDRLKGGGGKDVFLFDTIPDAVSNGDTIDYFTTLDDTIQLDRSVFTALAVGVLPEESFVVGTAAVDGNDHVIYDKSTGALYYDADGDGHAYAAVPFALLTHLTGTLTHADFVVVD